MRLLYMSRSVSGTARITRFLIFGRCTKHISLSLLFLHGFDEAMFNEEFHQSIIISRPDGVLHCISLGGWPRFQGPQFGEQPCLYLVPFSFLCLNYIMYYSAALSVRSSPGRGNWVAMRIGSGSKFDTASLIPLGTGDHDISLENPICSVQAHCGFIQHEYGPGCSF